MQLTKWDPFRDVEDMFDRYAKALKWTGRPRQEMMTAGDWAPRVDIAETETEFVIKAEIPEVKKEDVKISVEDGALKISGERKQEKEEKDKKFHRVERFYGSFMRSFILPDNIDESKIEATFKDGVLNVALPKTEKAKPKALEVKVK